jgi:hypothetical protein
MYTAQRKALIAAGVRVGVEAPNRGPMICRSELKQVQGRRDYPSLSLLAPTHRTHPASRKDRIVVKNLAAEGLDRLRGEFKKREVAGLHDADSRDRAASSG